MHKKQHSTNELTKYQSASILLQRPTVCSGQLSLLPSAGWEMSSSLQATGWMLSVADWGGGTSADCKLRVQLFADVGNDIYDNVKLELNLRVFTSIARRQCTAVDFLPSIHSSRWKPTQKTSNMHKKN